MALAATQTSHLVKSTDQVERNNPNRVGGATQRCPHLCYVILIKAKFLFIDGLTVSDVWSRPIGLE